MQTKVIPELVTPEHSVTPVQQVNLPEEQEVESGSDVSSVTMTTSPLTSPDEATGGQDIQVSCMWMEKCITKSMSVQLNFYSHEDHL